MDLVLNKTLAQGEGLHVQSRVLRTAKVDEEDNHLSWYEWLCHVVRPDLPVQKGPLLRLRMHPLGGHAIRRLPGFWPDEASVPERPLLPLMPDVDVSNGGYSR